MTSKEPLSSLNLTSFAAILLYLNTLSGGFAVICEKKTEIPSADGGPICFGLAPSASKIRHVRFPSTEDRRTQVRYLGFRATLCGRLTPGHGKACCYAGSKQDHKQGFEFTHPTKTAVME